MNHKISIEKVYSPAILINNNKKIMPINNKLN